MMQNLYESFGNRIILALGVAAAIVVALYLLKFAFQSMLNKLLGNH